MACVFTDMLAPTFSTHTHPSNKLGSGLPTKVNGDKSRKRQVAVSQTQAWGGEGGTKPQPPLPIGIRLPLTGTHHVSRSGQGLESSLVSVPALCQVEF